MKFCIVGDPHIGGSTSQGKVGIGATLNSRVADRIGLLDWTLETVVEQNAKYIIITGDVFEDPKPHPSFLAMFVSWLKKCQAHDIGVHIVVGNHDIFRTGNYYTSPLDVIAECELENVSIYKDIDTIFIDKVALTFMPFRDRRSFNTMSNAEALQLLKDSLIYDKELIPATYQKILVGHLALEGSIPVGDELDDLSNEIFCPLDMFNGYDYVWMGHIHKPQIMLTSPHIAHIGSMDISNFGETDQKKNIILYDTDNKSFNSIVLPTRPLKKICVSVPKDTKDTTTFVVNDIKNNYSDLNKAIVRLEVHLTSPELLPIDRKTVEKYLYDLGAFHIAAISESKKLSPIKKDGNTMDTTMDVVSAIKTYASSHIDDNNREQFIATAVEIYNQFQAAE